MADAGVVAEPEYVSRKGYSLKDLVCSFLNNMNEHNTSGAGKLMHYTADMLCSGGILLWQRLCWDFAFENIGIANPMIFPFLQNSFRKLNTYYSKYPLDTFCRIQEIQKQNMETVLILQMCQRKPKIKMPSIPLNTHDNPSWLQSNTHMSVVQVPHRAVRKIWHSSYDTQQALYGGNELAYACLEGSVERALFWMKWMTEEDTIHRKKYGTGLTTMERGPESMARKQRGSIGLYICFILSELYKDFVERALIRMNEEFHSLFNIYSGTDSCITARRKTTCLVIMIQILTEVPKWKEASSPPLIKDKLEISMLTAQSEIFFREILSLPIPRKALPASAGNISRKAPVKKKETAERLDLVDDLIMNFYSHPKR